VSQLAWPPQQSDCGMRVTQFVREQLRKARTHLDLPTLGDPSAVLLSQVSEDTNCTTPSLIPTVNGNTVRSFPTHGHLSADIPQQTGVHHPIYSRRRYYSTQCTDIPQQTGAHHPYCPGGGTTAHSVLTCHTKTCFADAAGEHVPLSAAAAQYGRANLRRLHHAPCV
jgi:hypothetical protein